jgi:hypothetical protein
VVKEVVMKLLSLILGLALVATAEAGPARTAAVAPARPRVEVAFVLDTTGSMGGLIEGAKRRIWSIARRIGTGQPRPELRIALVGYRDLGDEYVTRVHDFSGDMDEVYANLSAFAAQGGGDGPEHVSAALHDAVHRVAWSGGQTLKVIFLVGDAPPHVDYQDGFDYRRHVREARARGIVVETVQCGADPQTAAVWREVAQGGDGHYAQIDGSGGMPLRVTPVDAELARLNAELSRTVVASGTAADRADVERRMSARRAMPAAVATEAAGFFGDSAPRLADKDLVDLPEAEQRRELAKKAEEKAPVLQGKSEAEALVYLKGQKEQRGRLQARIRELQKERDRHLSAGTRDAFDEQVVQQLKERAGAHGITY